MSGTRSSNYERGSAKGPYSYSNSTHYRSGGSRLYNNHNHDNEMGNNESKDTNNEFRNNNSYHRHFQESSNSSHSHYPTSQRPYHSSRWNASSTYSKPNDQRRFDPHRDHHHPHHHHEDVNDKDVQMSSYPSNARWNEKDSYASSGSKHHDSETNHSYHSHYPSSSSSSSSSNHSYQSNNHYHSSRHKNYRQPSYNNYNTNYRAHQKEPSSSYSDEMGSDTDSAILPPEAAPNRITFPSPDIPATPAPAPAPALPPTTPSPAHASHAQPLPSTPSFASSSLSTSTEMRSFHPPPSSFVTPNRNPSSSTVVDPRIASSPFIHPATPSGPPPSISSSSSGSGSPAMVAPSPLLSHSHPPQPSPFHPSTSSSALAPTLSSMPATTVSTPMKSSTSFVSPPPPSIYPFPSSTPACTSTSTSTAAGAATTTTSSSTETTASTNLPPSQSFVTTQLNLRPDTDVISSLNIYLQRAGLPPAKFSYETIAEVPIRFTAQCSVAGFAITTLNAYKSKKEAKKAAATQWLHAYNGLKGENLVTQVPEPCTPCKPTNSFHLTTPQTTGTTMLGQAPLLSLNVPTPAISEESMAAVPPALKKEGCITLLNIACQKNSVAFPNITFIESSRGVTCYIRTEHSMVKDPVFHSSRKEAKEAIAKLALEQFATLFGSNSSSSSSFPSSGASTSTSSSHPDQPIPNSAFATPSPPPTTVTSSSSSSSLPSSNSKPCPSSFLPPSSVHAEPFYGDVFPRSMPPPTPTLGYSHSFYPPSSSSSFHPQGFASGVRPIAPNAEVTDMDSMETNRMDVDKDVSSSSSSSLSSSSECYTATTTNTSTLTSSTSFLPLSNLDSISTTALLKEFSRRCGLPFRSVRASSTPHPTVIEVSVSHLTEMDCNEEEASRKVLSQIADLIQEATSTTKASLPNEKGSNV